MQEKDVEAGVVESEKLLQGRMENRSKVSYVTVTTLLFIGTSWP